MRDRLVKVERFDLWRVLDDQDLEDAPFHLENHNAVLEALCGRSLVGGTIIIQTAGKVKVCRRCMERRFDG